MPPSGAGNVIVWNTDEMHAPSSAGSLPAFDDADVTSPLRPITNVTSTVPFANESFASVFS